ncbi:hypothetical protein, partial [Caproicibacter fermentans]|uniref:hypothetical protein n=1 Tax=Caproicibacter fermentans TaxID=2576756 RepID=UPI001A9C26ED
SWRSDSTAGGHSGGTVTGAHVTGDMGHFRPAFWVKKVPALTVKQELRIRRTKRPGQLYAKSSFTFPIDLSHLRRDFLFWELKIIEKIS